MAESKRDINIALVGNPNSGKTTLFNILTGLRKKVGNYPGVTVDKSVGRFDIAGNRLNLLDLPGLYSLFPNSADEKVAIEILTNPRHEDHPDLIICVADATNLERHLLLATQVLDLGIPMIMAVNMIDLLDEDGQKIKGEALQEFLEVPVVLLSKTTEGSIDQLKGVIASFIEKGEAGYLRGKSFLPKSMLDDKAIRALCSRLDYDNTYRAKIHLHHADWLSSVADQKEVLKECSLAGNFENIKSQVDETMYRFGKITPVVQKTISAEQKQALSLTDRVDNIITHRIWGPLIFFAILFVIFQAIFSWSELPMTWIEESFAALGSFAEASLPAGWGRDLLIDGVIAGLGGVVIFIPQIAILFFFIAILEESGYMARAVFMFDDVMRRFGLNGRSIVALVSSSACAIPAIMSTRTITDWKERLTTILVSPLISCNARIPVYAILVTFVVPSTTYMGFNLRGIAFFGLYALGVVAALVTALILKYTLKVESNSYLMIEMPQYKNINWKQTLGIVFEKVSIFIKEAGKIILLISMILWFLASYGPADKMQQAELLPTNIENVSDIDKDQIIASQKLEASYIGHLGKFIEPAIQPLGFDWKIGIALISSFAAREVFVSTMATIYSVGDAENDTTLREKMTKELRPDGSQLYSPATALSLLIFYVFAMQCMSTLAVTKRETKSWKWPIIQFVYMGALAYIGSYIAYNFVY